MPTQLKNINKHLYYQVILREILLRKQIQEFRKANQRIQELAQFYRNLPKLLLPPDPLPFPIAPPSIEPKPKPKMDRVSIRGMVGAVRKLGTGKSD